MSTVKTPNIGKDKKVVLKDPKVETVGNSIIATYAKDEFLENSPVSEEVIKQVVTYQNDYVEELANKATDIAIKAFNNDEDITKVHSEAPYMIDDKVACTIYKDYEIIDAKGNKTNDPEIIINIEQSNKLKDSMNNMQKQMTEVLNKD